jgi:hypothetical protein
VQNPSTMPESVQVMRPSLRVVDGGKPVLRHTAAAKASQFLETCEPGSDAEEAQTIAEIIYAFACRLPAESALRATLLRCALLLAGLQTPPPAAQ